MSLVSLVKAGNALSLQESIMKSLELINFQFDSSLRKIAIKPNMCYYLDYSTGDTTDPKFVGALIDVLRDNISKDIEISIVESDASAMKCKYAFKMLGYEKLAQDKHVKLVNLTNDQTRPVAVAVGEHNFDFLLPETINQADLFITVPKIKYMYRVKFSCALKNTYGCNPYPKKYKYHPCLDEAIVALNKIMKPDLCLIDGLITRGVSAFKLNLVMASTDVVAIDSAAATIAGLNPRSIGQIPLAKSEGLGQLAYNTMGAPIETFSNVFPCKCRAEKFWELVGRFYSQLTPKIV